MPYALDETLFRRRVSLLVIAWTLRCRWGIRYRSLGKFIIKDNVIATSLHFITQRPGGCPLLTGTDRPRIGRNRQVSVVENIIFHTDQGNYRREMIEYPKTHRLSKPT